MFKHILVATDGSDLATDAVKQASQLAQTLKAKITIVTVSSMPSMFFGPDVWSPIMYEDIAKAIVEHSEATLQKAAKLCTGDVDTVAVENASAADGIVETAERVGSDLIVMGSHGYRGINRLLLGSQASKVLSLAKGAVLIVKGHPQALT